MEVDISLVQLWTIFVGSSRTWLWWSEARSWLVHLVKQSQGRWSPKGEIGLILSFYQLLNKVPFLASNVIRQAHSDHNLIILDMLGKHPKNEPRDSRLRF